MQSKSSLFPSKGIIAVAQRLQKSNTMEYCNAATSSTVFLFSHSQIYKFAILLASEGLTPAEIAEIPISRKSERKVLVNTTTTISQK